VKVRCSLSEWMAVLSGVPQGSVLGPLLFLLFVNGLPSWIVNSIHMFADDMKIWCTIRDINDSLSLQKDLDSMVEWSDKYLLKFNVEKCKIMHIGQNSKRRSQIPQRDPVYIRHLQIKN